MGPKKDIDSGRAERKIFRATIEVKVKKQIISKFESGVRVSDLAVQFGMAKSTICTILKNKEAIKEANVAKGVKVLTKQRSQAIEEMEKLLLIWINQKQLAGENVSETVICEKARQLHDDLLKINPGMSADTVVFKASRGWLEKFKMRSGVHSLVKYRKATENFVQDFSDYIKAEGFLPEQVFSCAETGLFWKKLPRRTYITKEEDALPGHKSMKDRLTLLLCGNASGDFKAKPLLVYYSENPRTFRKNNVIKSKLPVMWKANNMTWVTRQIFIEWVREVFAPSVRKFLQEKNLPLKCLLVMDNAPAHPPGIEDDLTKEFDFIRVKLLPPNMAPLIQPMDQNIILNFRKLYTKELFQRCFEVTTETELTLREFWKNHFNIHNCLSILDKAWMQVTCRTMNSAWRKLWPDCVSERNIDDLEAESVAVVDDIVSLGKSMGLEVDSADVKELLEDHRNELTMEELELLHQEQHKMELEEMSSETEERRENIPVCLIKEMCAKWSEVQNFVEKYHPDKAVTNCIINLFNDNVMSHFRDVLKCKQKQFSVDKSLVRQRPNEFQGEPSGAKRLKREIEDSPEDQLFGF